MSSLILTDMQKQRLYDDGVNKNDYASHKDWYEKCVQCSGVFNTISNIPILLTCGHFCCEECLHQSTICLCCRQNKKVKMNKYKPFNEPQTTTTNARYDFCITMQSSARQKVVCKKKLSSTIEEILTEFSDFVDYEKINKEKVRIVIKTKVFIYSQIKKKTISQFQGYLTLNTANHIAIVDRFNGGILNNKIN